MFMQLNYLHNTLPYLQIGPIFTITIYSFLFFTDKLSPFPQNTSQVFWCYETYY